MASMLMLRGLLRRLSSLKKTDEILIITINEFKCIPLSSKGFYLGVYLLI